jgi:hypothetical protein
MKIKSILILLLLIWSQVSLASSFTVKKIKGRQAIIETLVPLEEGLTYAIESDTVAMDATTI